MEPRSTTADHDGRSTVTVWMTSGAQMISPELLRRYFGESESGLDAESSRPGTLTSVAPARASRLHAVRGSRVHRASPSGLQRSHGTARDARRPGARTGRARSEPTIRGTCRPPVDALADPRRVQRRGRRASSHLHDGDDDVLSRPAAG